MSTVSVQAKDVGYTGREERALELYRTRGPLIRSTASNTYEVPSSAGGMRGRRYTVTYGGAVEESCNCPDYPHGHGRACKHLLAVGVHHARRRGGVREVRDISVAAGDPFRVGAKPRQPSDAEVLAHDLIGDEERQELADRVARLRT